MSSQQNRIYIDDRGEGGMPVVFAHSAAGRSEHWGMQLEHSQKQRRSVAFDFAGHGRSAAPISGEVSIETMAENIAFVAEALDLPRFVLIGHSAGAAAAIAYAADNADRVAGLLLLDPSTDGRKMPQEVKEGVLAGISSPQYEAMVQDYWASMLVNARPRTKECVLKDLKDCPKSTVIDLVRALFSFDPVGPLQQYQGKRLCVYTDTTDNPLGLHQLVKNLPQQKVAGVGHWLQLDKPDVINQIIDGFISAD